MSIDISKFNWKQLFNDSQGKTSPQLLCGVVGWFVGLAGLIIGGLQKENEQMVYASGLLGMCMILLGTQQLTKDKVLSDTVIEKATEKKDETTI